MIYNGEKGYVMYCFESRVRYSETDNTGCLSLEGILDYFQDCSTFQSEDLGVGIQYLKEKKIAWVLSYWQIDVRRYPKLGEEIEIGTLPYEIKGFLGYRNFVLRTKHGEELACANTIWTLLDIQRGMPQKASEEIKSSYPMAERYPMDYAPRKIELPQGMQRCESIEVRQHHLDTNMHVNNGQYVRMAKDTVMQERPIRRLRAEYKNSAVLGDMICPYAAWDGTDRYVVSLCGADEKPYAIVELTYG